MSCYSNSKVIFTHMIIYKLLCSELSQNFMPNSKGTSTLAHFIICTLFRITTDFYTCLIPRIYIHWLISLHTNYSIQNYLSFYLSMYPQTKTPAPQGSIPTWRSTLEVIGGPPYRRLLLEDGRKAVLERELPWAWVAGSLTEILCLG